MRGAPEEAETILSTTSAVSDGAAASTSPRASGAESGFSGVTWAFFRSGTDTLVVSRVAPAPGRKGAMAAPAGASSIRISMSLPCVSRRQSADSPASTSVGSVSGGGAPTITPICCNRRLRADAGAVPPALRST